MELVRILEGKKMVIRGFKYKLKIETRDSCQRLEGKRVLRAASIVFSSGKFSAVCCYAAAAMVAAIPMSDGASDMTTISVGG